MTEARDDLISLSELAQYLGLAERTLYQWAQQGRIPGFKLGNSWRFRRAEIDAWLESYRSGPAVPPPEQTLTSASPPPQSKRQARATAKAEGEVQVKECVQMIEEALRNEDRDVWLVEQFTETFSQPIVDEAVDILRKQRRIAVSELVGLEGRKVKVLQRRR